MKLSLHKSLAIAIPVALLMASCKKDTGPEPTKTEDTPTGPSYNVPTTYNFTSVDYSSSTLRLAMLTEMVGHIRATHTSTVDPAAIIDAQKLKDMYVNANNTFTTTGANSSGLQLKDQTSNLLLLQTSLDALFDEAASTSTFAAATPTTASASNGTAGKLISPSRAILVDANGLEYKEAVEKGLMGAFIYYRATTILTNISTYDNTTVTNGTTAQEHAWDEAFGYFGVPIDFPTNTTGLKFWGSYSNGIVNTAISSNSTIMNAFLSGRAAITNKDDSRRNTAKDVVLATWEKVVAAKCINYMKGAKTNFAQAADRHHNLSEGVGFVKALNYNPSKIATNTQIATLLSYFPSNLYNMSTTDIDNVINSLASIYSLDASKL